MTTPHSTHYDPDSGYDPWTVQDKWWSDYPGNKASLMYLAPALKYLCRLGRKEGESIVKDLEKCIAYLNKCISIEAQLGSVEFDHDEWEDKGCKIEPNDAVSCYGPDVPPGHVYESLIERKIQATVAPEGYWAVKQVRPGDDRASCTGCAFLRGGVCKKGAEEVPCDSWFRIDHQDVIFVRKPL